MTSEVYPGDTWKLTSELGCLEIQKASENQELIVIYKSLTQKISVFVQNQIFVGMMVEEKNGPRTILRLVLHHQLVASIPYSIPIYPPLTPLLPEPGLSALPATQPAEEEFTDWEFLDNEPNHFEQRIKTCLDQAKENSQQEIPVDDWVLLTEDDYEKSFAEFMESIRKEAPYPASANLIAHLLELLDAGTIADHIPAAFDNGKIIPQSSGLSPVPPSKMLARLLTETYGPLLAKAVLHRYQLINKNALTVEDIKRAMLGISANVKITDLVDLYADIKKGVCQLHCITLLNPEDKHSLLRSGSFASLGPDQISLLLKPFQTLPKDGMPVPMLDLLFEGKSRGLALWAFDCFNHDTEAVKRLSTIDTADRSQLRLAISEHMCKNIAYLELKQGMIVPLLTEKGDKIFYTVFQNLQDKKDGILCSLLAPVNASQKKYSPEDPLILYLQFRGTQWQPGRKDSYESLQRDLDYAGIGKRSFQVREKEIADMVLEYLKSSAVPWIKLVISGHSLGGTDTQRTLRLFTKLLAQPSPPRPLDKIVAIDAFCHNSPAPEASLNDQFKADLKMLETKAKPIPIALTLVLFATDPLQNAGDMYLGAQTTSPLLSKKVCFLKSHEWRYFAAHRLKAFVGPKDPCDMTFIDKSSPDNLLEKIFSRHYYWNVDNDTWIQSSGKRIQWYGGYALSPLKVLMDGSFYYGFGLIRGIVRTLSQQRSEEAQHKGWGRIKRIVIDPSNY